MSGDVALAKLDSAQHALAECKTVMEAKQIADVAEAARVYLERTNASVETVNRAAEIRLLAERQMGDFLAQMPKNTGAKGVGTSAVPEGNRTLADIGITKKQSANSQKLAAMPAGEFHGRIEAAKATGEKLTASKVLQPPAPRPIRRVSAAFNLKDWQRQTATMLDLRFRDVPEEHAEAAVEYATSYIRRFIS